MDDARAYTLVGRVGLKIRAGDGTEEHGSPEMMSTPLFILARPGDRLRLLDAAYKFNVATYAPEIDPAWIATYTYAPDQSWTRYRGDLRGDTYRQQDYVFAERVYFRVCLRKLDGSLFDGSEELGRILALEATAPETYAAPPWLIAEAERAASRARALRGPDTLTFALLTDTHYNVNGTFADTVASLRLVHDILGLDGVIHLGDFTDGMVTADAARHYVNLTMDGLKATGAPVWAALGNHDSNYFRQNPERLTQEEQSALYLNGHPPRYSVDFTGHGLRLIFLDSFDPDEEVRYGYTPECATWLEETLDGMPEGWRAIVCSHLPPMCRLQYWSKALRGEAAVMAVLRGRAGRILAFINGHNHADRLDNADGFPIVSNGNAKCEAFLEHKTEGFVTPERHLGDASQELWDILLVSPGRGTIRFVRFGAGRDRIIENGRAAWL